MQWANWQVLLSLICYAGLIFGAVIGYKKRKLFSFSVFFFIASLSIVSNLIFPVGTNMAERFMFMPSLAFALTIGYLIFKLIERKQIKLGISLFSVLILLYGWKTIDRNQVWKNDYTLFTTDVLTSVNSAKVLNAAGGALSTSVVSLDDEAEKTKRIQQAIGYLNRAIEIHPRYRNAYLLLGNCYYYSQDFPQAIEYYDQTLSISPGYPDALKNRRTAYRDAGRYYGEKMGDLTKALFYLKKAYEEMPEDIETIRLLGVCHGMMKNHDEAISLFKKWTELAPDNAYAWRNLTAAFGAKGDEAQAALAQAKAISLDPEIFSK
jgi:tetratricopeptide (TPR) repeat protein